MKGLILAGGAGSRLYPLTSVVTKQLQPIYDKPMIYYPLSLLMMSGVTDILIITTRTDQALFKDLLGNGERFGLKLSYEIQPYPRGIAEAYLIAESFLDGDDSLMVLGDNLFHGDFTPFRAAIQRQTFRGPNSMGQIFAYAVTDPERYGVVEFDEDSKKVISIVEKPASPLSKYAVTGLYLFDGSAPERAKKQKPSIRGELEITDLIQTYLDDKALKVKVIGEGMVWLDTGTPQTLLQASSYIATVEQRQGTKVACLEEIGLEMGFLNAQSFSRSLEKIPRSPYRNYLETIKL
jgi:glucose-1-phosphate thymidylyltransferase